MDVLDRQEVVANAARGTVRSAKLADRLRAVTSRLPISDSLPATTARPADQGLEVRYAVARLEPEFAEVVRMVHRDGFSLGDVAVFESISACTVRSCYGRAKRELAVPHGVQVPGVVPHAS